jgi:hypothetical protein
LSATIVRGSNSFDSWRDGGADEEGVEGVESVGVEGGIKFCGRVAIIWIGGDEGVGGVSEWITFRVEMRKFGGEEMEAMTYGSSNEYTCERTGGI